jgi:tetratricopeptide (TPR) repeat protein
LLILFISAALFADNPAAELEKKLQTVSGKEKIQVLNDLADYYFRKIPAKTIEYGTQALELSEKLKDEKGKARALKLMGIGCAILGNLQKAIQFSEKAMEVYEKTGDEINTANCLNTIGNVYNNLSNYYKALEYHSRALEIRRTLGQKSGISASLNNMGLVYNNQGNFDRALQCYLESLKIDEEMGDKIGVSQSLNNIGLVYDNLGNNESALKYYLQALKIDEAIGNKRSIANCLHNIGNVYDNLKQPGKALEYHERAKKYREEIGDKRGLAASLDNMGLIYARQGSHEKALDFYLQSLKLREEIGEKSGVASVLINIGSLYNHLENFDKALSNLERALKIAREIDAKNILMHINLYISETYSAISDFKKALEYYKRYSEIKDTVINKQSNDKIAELQAKYEAEKKEKEIALLEKNNRIQTITRNALIAGFVLVLIIVLLLLRKFVYLITFWKKKNYIGHYRINSQIGSGGMGIVYKATHVRQGSDPVAIKVIREEYSQDPVQRKRFLNEAILVDQLNHPNIVKVFERGEYNQQLFIAMEFLQGQSLADLIQKGENIPITDGLNIMRQLVNALAKVHSKGIIHRDLKPENILLIEKKENKYFVKLLDFGLAKSQSLTRLTETGQILGTVNYLPPEQITHQEVSLASDIYALGVVFYEMLTLEKPFLGDYTIDIIKQIIEKEPIEPCKLRSEIPAELNDLILKMLSKKIEARPTEEMVLASIEYLHDKAQ